MSLPTYAEACELWTQRHKRKARGKNGLSWYWVQHVILCEQPHTIPEILILLDVLEDNFGEGLRPDCADLRALDHVKEWLQTVQAFQMSSPVADLAIVSADRPDRWAPEISREMSSSRILGVKRPCAVA